jgi:hypothetical protein
MRDRLQEGRGEHHAIAVTAGGAGRLSGIGSPCRLCRYGELLAFQVPNLRALYENLPRLVGL